MSIIIKPFFDNYWVELGLPRKSLNSTLYYMLIHFNEFVFACHFLLLGHSYLIVRSSYLLPVLAENEHNLTLKCKYKILTFTKIWDQFDPKDWLNPDQSSLAKTTHVRPSGSNWPRISVWGLRSIAIQFYRPLPYRNNSHFRGIKQRIFAGLMSVYIKEKLWGIFISSPWVMLLLCVLSWQNFMINCLCLMSHNNLS